MQPLEIDSAVFCDGAHYTIISRENSSILTCPVTSGAGGYTLNRVGGSEIDREIGGLTGHAACIAVDVPTWCRIAGDPAVRRKGPGSDRHLRGTVLRHDRHRRDRYSRDRRQLRRRAQ